MNGANRVRACIDCRRGDHGGIGRVTQELCRTLAARPEIDAVALGSHPNPDCVSGDLEIIPFEASHLSLEEHETLPKVLNEAGVSVYVTPQFYNTPLLEVPLVSWVHDTWPIRHPEWLPRPEEVFGKFTSGSKEVARRLMMEYSQLRMEGRLFPNNAFLEEHSRSAAGPFERTVVAMFALNLHRSARIVTCSNDARSDLERLFPETREKVRVIYNAIPTLPAPAPATSSTIPRILHVSKWEPRKNLERLITAFSILVRSYGELELHLVGGAVNQGERTRGLDAIAASPAASRIVVHGPVSDAALAELYASSTAVVLPSLFEGFSLPMVEAMAAGVPVAAAEVGAIPEIAGGAAVLFDPRDPEAIANALRKLLDDSQLRADQVRRGTERVRDLQSRDFGAQVAETIAEAVAVGTH